jgi:hypothetical protein
MQSPSFSFKDHYLPPLDYHTWMDMDRRTSICQSTSHCHVVIVPPPDTVRGLRSFIGAYNVLGRVLPKCSHIIAPLESAIAGQQSGERILWTDMLRERFRSAQTNLTTQKSITLPRPSDQLWIITDGSVTKHGIRPTLYITRNEKLNLAGIFSAKLQKHQVSWLPCEIEALSIAAAVKHFSTFIIQSTHQACLLTDSKPCVQGFEKLCRSKFSASPQVTFFLSIVSRYQVNVRHLAGTANVPSDFASRNAPECNEPRCQICNFVALTEDSVVHPHLFKISTVIWSPIHYSLSLDSNPVRMPGPPTYTCPS